MKFSITGARMLSPLLSNPLSGKCLIKRTRYSGKFTTLTSRVSRNIYVKNTRYITTRLLYAFVPLCNRRPLSSSPISHSQYHTYHPKILNHAMPQRNIITTIRSGNPPRFTIRFKVTSIVSIKQDIFQHIDEFVLQSIKNTSIYRTQCV